VLEEEVIFSWCDGLEVAVPGWFWGGLGGPLGAPPPMAATWRDSALGNPMDSRNKEPHHRPQQMPALYIAEHGPRWDSHSWSDRGSVRWCEVI
jgi:hypothetical protein